MNVGVLMKTRIDKILMSVCLLTLCLCANAKENQSIANKIQVLKQQAVLLHKDLAQLEQELIYPSTTQIAIYVSKNLRENVALGNIELSIDGMAVTRYIYSNEENSALELGGMQRLFMGNVAVGEHEFEVVLKGTKPNGDIINLKARTAYYKNTHPLSININLSDGDGTNSPLLSVIRL